MREEWKSIENSKYQISDKGRVKNSKTNRILKPFDVKGLSLRIRLPINGKRKGFKIHRLVALAFIPNPENKPEVDHIDRDIFNNTKENLRWATREENCQNRLLISKNELFKIYELFSLGSSVDEVYKIIKNNN